MLQQGRNYSLSYHSGDFEMVKKGNDGESKIDGIDEIVLIMNLRYRVVLKNVRHVLEST